MSTLIKNTLGELLKVKESEKIENVKNKFLELQKPARLHIQTSDQNNEIRFELKKLNNSAFKSMLEYYDNLISSPTEYILTGMLTALSGAIGKKAYFQFRENFPLYLNIWSVIIGKSTIMKKTTVLNEVLKDIDDINICLFNDYKAKLETYEMDKDVRGKKDDNYKPKREFIRFPDDTTVESLGEILSHQQRGILRASEFGGFLKRLNKGYAGDVKEFLTDIFDVPKTYEISRIIRGNVLIERPYLSILGASTIEWFKDNINSSDLRAGFLARFIYSIRDTNEKPYIPFLKLENISHMSENKFDTRKVYDRLIQLPETQLKFTNDAKERHIKYDEDSHQELTSLNNEELSFKARLLAYSFKIAGIIALTNNRTNIEVQDVEDSILITEYYKKNVEKLLNEQLIYSEFQIKENKIYNMIEGSNNKEIKHSELLNRSNMDRHELALIIQTLEEKEKIRYEMRKTGKKPSKFYIAIHGLIK